jgi:hypothetical protein
VISQESALGEHRRTATTTRGYKMAAGCSPCGQGQQHTPETTCRLGMTGPGDTLASPLATPCLTPMVMSSGGDAQYDGCFRDEEEVHKV